MNAKSSQARTLFFLADAVATPAEIAAAQALPGHVVFRNATQVRAGDCLERCSFVAGSVPAPYAEIARADQPSLPGLEAGAAPKGPPPAPAAEGSAPPAGSVPAPKGKAKAPKGPPPA